MLKRIAKQKKERVLHLKEGNFHDLLINDNKTEEDISFRDLNAQLQAAVDKLSPQQKQVYRLIKELGYTREEAAHALGLSSETVKTHLDRAMKSIRAFLMADLKLVLVALASVLGIRW
jgi:RNA polymerase sigma-70 factor (ECF subfamily)